MNYVIGIDAGGTKTHLVLADEAGAVVAEARGPGANVSTAGEPAVERTFRSLIDEAAGSRGIAPAAFGLGVAGAERPEDHRVLRGIMRRIAGDAPAVIANDALVALVAGAGDGPGVVLIAGTGSIVFGRNRANLAARAGGWGYVLADEGSGYWIAKQALSAVMRQFDGRGAATSLTPLVLAHLGIASPIEIGPLIYGGTLPPASIAALAPLVGRAADEGDAASAKILSDACDELVVAAGSVVRRLGMERESFPFLLSGGTFGLSRLAGETSRRLPGLAPAATVRRLTEAPAGGAVHLALAALRGEARLPEYV